MCFYLHLLAVHSYGMPDARLTIQRVADGVGMDNRPARHVDGLAQLLGRARHVVCGNDALPVFDFQPFMTVLEPNVRSRDAYECRVHLVTRLILDGLDGHANRTLGRRNVRDDTLSHPGVLGRAVTKDLHTVLAGFSAHYGANLRGTYVDSCYDLV